MRIRLKFFGPLRDVAKMAETEIRLKEDTTVGDLVRILGERFPNLQEHLKVVSFSIDDEYASREAVLNDGDEVGLLPPISGGSAS